MCRKTGRFIPCRGGGTSTTYYTDEHDVDEDLRTISAQGGEWPMGKQVGITNRHLYRSSPHTSDFAASRLIYLS